jgi:hypothetical protein
LGALPRENFLIALIRDRLGVRLLGDLQFRLREPRSVTGTTLANRWVRNCFAIDTPSNILLRVEFCKESNYD